MRTLNPCGYRMDWLRSCYRVPMIFRDGDEPVMVRWYFCDEDAECFPYEHVFGSQNWEREKTDRTIGEQAGPRTWVDGERPENGDDGQDAQHCFDPAEWWTDGIPDGEETGPYWDNFTSKCCNPCNCEPPDILYWRVSDGLCDPFIPLCTEESITYLELHRNPDGSPSWFGEGPANRPGHEWRVAFYCEPFGGQWCCELAYYYPDSEFCALTVCETLTCPDPFLIAFGQIVLEPSVSGLSCPCAPGYCVDVLISDEFIS